MPIQLAVQLQTDTPDPKLVFSREERTEIAREVAEHYPVIFLPPLIPGPRRGRKLSKELQTVIIVFVFGTAFSSLVKPFFDAVLAEAGKDFWNALKSLIGSIWHRQARVYNFSTRTFVVFEHHDEYVAFAIRYRRGQDLVSTDNLHSYLEATLRTLAASWDDLQTLIKKRDIGHPRDAVPRVHVIGEIGGAWTLIRSAPKAFLLGRALLEGELAEPTTPERRSPAKRPRKKRR